MQLIEYTKEEMFYWYAERTPLPGDLIRNVTERIDHYSYGIVISVNDDAFKVLWADDSDYFEKFQ